MKTLAELLRDLFTTIFGAHMQNFTNNLPHAVTVTVVGQVGSWNVAPEQTVELPDGDIVVEGPGGSGGEGGGGPGDPD